MKNSEMAPILKTECLTKNFGALCAVNELDIEIQWGEIVGLIGPNGAGKSTVFNLITGFIKPSGGRVLYKGSEVTGRKPYQLCGLGLSRTFQMVNNFPEFTVLQNVLLGGHRHARINPRDFLSWPPKPEVRAAMEILNLVNLENVANEKAMNLASGQQKMLQFGIALMAQPDLLLLDEPLSGMTPDEVNFVLQIIQNIQSQGVTVFLIEHHMHAVMSVCRRIIVIDFGVKIAEGIPQYIQNHPKVIEIYLGVVREEHVA